MERKDRDYQKHPKCRSIIHPSFGTLEKVVSVDRFGNYMVCLLKKPKRKKDYNLTVFAYQTETPLFE